MEEHRTTTHNYVHIRRAVSKPLHVCVSSRKRWSPFRMLCTTFSSTRACGTYCGKRIKEGYKTFINTFFVALKLLDRRVFHATSTPPQCNRRKGSTEDIEADLLYRGVRCHSVEGDNGIQSAHCRKNTWSRKVPGGSVGVSVYHAAISYVSASSTYLK